ncbi:MAP7 domain-containing protein 2-like isoform X8 [Vespula maculifrons]|uniref:MAP7 domain-containing protein 2-like isoform X8 n=1 Tax=Vespula maculifrons TaxID=7453 RepID=A0ABD2CS81_VESMC
MQMIDLRNGGRVARVQRDLFKRNEEGTTGPGVTAVCANTVHESDFSVEEQDFQQCQDNSDMGGGVRMNREIPSSTLATLRGILVSSLSRENLGPNDLSTIHENVRLRPPRKVHFREDLRTKSVECYSNEFGQTRMSQALFCGRASLIVGVEGKFQKQNKAKQNKKILDNPY